jgi:ribulose-phosphate 3-epimerase
MSRELLGGVHVAPSILSADFSRLGEQVQTVLDAGARVIHVDVMDGHFVPPITIGPLAVAALRELIHDAGAMIDVHLMIERPERQVPDFASAGADSITFHAEATPHAARVAHLIREHGATAGVAINPGTPVEALTDLAGAVDLVLCMTVNPGWGGQPFIEHSTDKLQRLSALLAGTGAAIEVDGGIDTDTAGPCRAAGANLFVAGSAVFGAPDPAEAFRAIAAAAEFAQAASRS